uniref:Phytocyanin domain-containing protein n=1 Tax=Lotus japonicus TaxID=34305 RepID=I3STL3_LOTJA|nr:unknown [Lotus japonicus]
MAVKFTQALIMLVITVSMFAVSMANKDWSSGFNYTDWWSRFGNHHHNKTQQQQQPKQILVGGSEHWHFGYNYSDWAIKSAPFYLNDTLVFKFDAPNTSTFPHSVYMFKDIYSFMNCDIKRAKMLANPTQGAGEGFMFVSKKWQPYFFGCGERNGFHCNNGTMKFAVMPMLRPFWSWP